MSEGFWETERGQRLLDKTLPALLELLERIADALETLITWRARRDLGG